MNKNLIKGTLLGLVLICTNSAMAKEPCTIVIDGNTEYTEDGAFGLYPDEFSKSCSQDRTGVTCLSGGEYLGSWYSTCKFKGNSPTVLKNGDLKICGTEYISNSSGAQGCITIQGKNVGATTTGAGPDAPSTSYGNYYQYGDNTPRTESNWFTGQVWNSNTPDFTGCLSADNAWGGGVDNMQPVYPIDNESERQGPCDTGYHVPSQGEWYALMDMWAGSSINGYIRDYSYGLEFYTDFQIPFAGERNFNDGSLEGSGSVSVFWSSTTNLTVNQWNCRGESAGIFVDNRGVSKTHAEFRARGHSVRCFKNSAPALVSTINDSTTTTIRGNTVTGLPETMTVTENTISTAEGKEVLGEVNVDFGSNQTATFSHPVQVKIPVSNHEQVIVKVKHGGDTTYGFAGLTRNSSASCNNGEPTSNQYNGETINVVDGYATIYSCAASSFIALGVENDGNSKIVVSIAALNSGQNTCSGEDFIFPAITAKPSQQVIYLAKKFQCIFGSSASKAITLALSGDLADGNGNVISGENVKLSNPEWTEQPSGLKVGNTVFSKQTFLGQGKTLFNKTGSKIGTAEGSGVEIEITVPGGTPDGTYNGTLVLTY